LIEEEVRDTRPVPVVVTDTREHQAVKLQPPLPAMRETPTPSFKMAEERKSGFTWKHYILVAAVLALLIVIGVVYARRARSVQSAPPPAEQPVNHSEQQSAPQQQTAQTPVEIVNAKTEPPKLPPPKTKTDDDASPVNANTPASETETKQHEQPAAPEQPKETETKTEPPPQPPPQPRPEENPPEPAPRTVESQAIERVAPIYPSEARARRITGDVVVEVEISKKGKVKSARVISGHVLLHEAALNAARKWKFAPATLDGQPVKSTRTITFRF
jgi:protein TonB